MAIAADFEEHLALSGSMDRALRLWDLRAHACIGTLEGHNGTVNSLSANFKAARAASGDDHGEIRIWDISNLECVCFFVAHRSPVRGLVASFTVTLDTILSCGEDATLKLWKVTGIVDEEVRGPN